MRSKEEANDYRYFPDPDLLPLIITDKDIEEIKKTMPELPEAMKNRFEKDLGLSIYDSEGITSNRDVTKYFLELVDLGTNAKLAANWVLGNLFSQLNNKDIDILDSPISPSQLSSLINRIEDGTISNNAAKKIFEILWGNTGKKVDQIIDDLGLKQISDSNEIDGIVDEVLKNNLTMVEEFKSGKEKAFNALIGQVMKASKGKANPAQVSSTLKEKLSK
jgi:aspartyl-tRNA(Asn)/glutamyl-tRNA(Gln) amidotransferase subunit B